MKSPHEVEHAVRRRRTGTLIFLLCFISIAWFNNGAHWNQNARLNSIFSFVEPGSTDQYTFRIGRFLRGENTFPVINTGDWVIHENRFYSNKAPGTTLIGVPFYLALFHLEGFVGVDVHDPKVEILNAWLINLFVTALPAAIGMVLLFLLLLRLGASECRSVAIVLALFFGTGLFPYSTQLWGHTTTAAFMIAALYAFLSRPELRPYWSLFWAGFASGLAVCTEYQAFVFTAMLGVFVLYKEKGDVLYYIAGGLPCLVLYAAYHQYCFGNPLVFALSYFHPGFIEEEKTFGLFGAVSLTVFWKLLFSIERGIFVQMPVLGFCLLGFIAGIRANPKSELLWFSIVVCFTWVLLISGFNGWHGGATVVSRYLIPIFPLLVIGLLYLPWTRWWIGAFAVVSVVSVSNMFAVAAVSPLVEDQSMNPILITYQRFLAGEFQPFLATIRLHGIDPGLSAYQDFVTWNAGQLMGLGGHWSLLPLVLVQCGLIVLISRSLRLTGPASMRMPG